MRHFSVASFIVCLLASASLAGQPVQKWEYATLLVSDDVGATWRAEGSHKDADLGDRRKNTFSIYQHLGGKIKAEEFQLGDLLNAAGDKGWELAHVEKLSKIDMYIFKRPKA